MRRGYLVPFGVSFKAGWAVATLMSITEPQAYTSRIRYKHYLFSPTDHQNLTVIKIGKSRVRGHCCSPL